MINKAIFWDTSGNERYRASALKTLEIFKVKGIILFFDFTSKKSFFNLERWLDEIKENFNDEKVIVLFGNKIDIEKERWEVTSEEAKKYAQKKNLALFETSAKENIGIKEGLSYIANKFTNKALFETSGKENIGIKEGFSYIANKAHLITEKKMGKNIKLNRLLKYINF